MTETCRFCSVSLVGKCELSHKEYNRLIEAGKLVRITTLKIRTHKDDVAKAFTKSFIKIFSEESDALFILQQIRLLNAIEQAIAEFKPDHIRYEDCFQSGEGLRDSIEQWIGLYRKFGE